MSAAVVVNNAYKTYKNLSSSLWKRASLSNRSYGSGLLDQLPAVVAIDRLSFIVEEGQIFGLIGPNGSGKSTLLRLLATVLPLDDGQIKIFGFDTARQHMQARRMINPVAAEASFFRKLSPLDNLVQDGRQYGLDEREATRQVLNILTRLGMQERFILSPMEDLSSGMHQTIALARAILSQPRLLLLDEPSSGLDPYAKRQLHSMLSDLRQQFGMTIVFATQDIKEADLLCDQVAILDRGHLVALDSPKALGSSPATSLEDAFLELTRCQHRMLEAEIA